MNRYSTFTRPRTSLRRRNPERAERNFIRQFESEERVRWYQRQPCCVPGCKARGLSVCHHVTTRGAGGGPDDMIPLCPEHHRECHHEGCATFAERHRMMLRATVGAYAMMWGAR